MEKGEENKLYPNIQTEIREKLIVEFSGDCKEKSILDLGGGHNRISDVIIYKKRYVLDANKAYDKLDITCDLNTEEIPLEDRSIDVIMAGELIEHLKNPIGFLKKCYKVLKDDGTIVISTPNIASFKNRIRLLFGMMPEYCSKTNMSGEEGFQDHIKDFNLSELKKIFNNTNFEINSIGTNGIIFHSKLIFPRFLTPISFGENIIVSIKKVKE